MRNISRIVISTITLLSAVSCGNNTKTLLPNVSGKAGEVIIVVGKDNWEGNLGNEIGSLRRSDIHYLTNRAMSFPKASTISSSSRNIPTICAAVRNLSLGLRPVIIS